MHPKGSERLTNRPTAAQKKNFKKSDHVWAIKQIEQKERGKSEWEENIPANNKMPLSSPFTYSERNPNGFHFKRACTLQWDHVIAAHTQAIGVFPSLKIWAP